MFQSDFRIVADYFIQMRKNKKYVPSEITIRHVYEILELMAIMTGDDQFLECEEGLGERKEKMTMGDVFGALIAEGEAWGKKKGWIGWLLLLIFCFLKGEWKI